MIAEVVQRGDATPPELMTELNRGSRRGTSIPPRRVLEEVLAGAHSVAEIDARDLWRHSGLPEMLANHDIEDEQGRFLARRTAGSTTSLLRGRSIRTTGI